MSAVAGLAAKALPLASKVMGSIPVIGSAIKTAGGIAKKVVGGIKSIFTGGGSSGQSQGISPTSENTRTLGPGGQARGGFGGMMDDAQSFMRGARGMFDAGRSIYQGFKEGGLSGGMQSFSQQMPSMRESFGGMMDAGRSAYSRGRDMYDQGRSLAQDTMSDIRRLRRGFQGGGFGGMSPMGGY